MRYWIKIKRFLAFLKTTYQIYGIRFYFDKKYAVEAVRSRRSKISSRRSKKKYGSGFLSSKQHIKRKIARRQGWGCKLCRKLLPSEVLTIDHIVRVSDGGTNEYSNLQFLCRSCHNTKDGISPKFSTGTLASKNNVR